MANEQQVEISRECGFAENVFFCVFCILIPRENNMVRHHKVQSRAISIYKKKKPHSTQRASGSNKMFALYIHYM